MPHNTPDFGSDSLTHGIIGLGYVGLPLAVEATRGGLHVLGFDIAPHVVEGINAGRSHIQDVPDEQVAEARREGTLEATTDFTRLAECDAISICVPTPLSKTRDPDVSFILEASESVAATLRPGQLVILESTTYPGTTREVMKPVLERGGLVAGEDFHLCFSPERVDPGNPTWNLRNTPKVVGGLTDACRDACVALYSRFIDEVVPVSSTDAAELTKILENTFRTVNIGLVNETAIVADRLGVNVWEVIEAAATKPFGFMPFVPGPGLGGHCIPVDPHYLSWKMRTLNYRTRFIDLASEVNAEMPMFVVGKVRQALNEVRKAVNGSSVLVLGVAYKRNIDDVRESPAFDVIELLEKEGAEVSYHDPYVPLLEEDGHSRRSVELTDELLSGSDAVVIVTDHSDFDYGRIFDQARVLVDARNATSRVARSMRSGDAQRWIVKSGDPVESRPAAAGARSA